MSAWPYPFFLIRSWNSRASERNSASRPSTMSRSVTDRRVLSKSANDALQETRERPPRAPARRDDVVVDKRLRAHTGGHVRDARNGQNLDTHVTRREGLRNRGHAHRVRANHS